MEPWNEELASVPNYSTNFSPTARERRVSQVTHQQLCGIDVASGFEQVEHAQMIFDVAPYSRSIGKCTVSEQATN